jgi:hypothetical protein
MGELRVLRHVIASERWEEEEVGEYRMMANFIFSSAHEYIRLNISGKLRRTRHVSRMGEIRNMWVEIA